MTMLHFDEEGLKKDLSALPKAYRVAFAAACAQRLLPAYFSFRSETKPDDSIALANILAHVWDSLIDEKHIEFDIEAMLELAMSLIPQYDEDPVPILQPAAEDAGAAVAYTLRCYRSGDAQEAAWSGRRVYEAMDNWVIQQERMKGLEGSTDEEILRHPLVQNELDRQQRDLNELRRSIESDAYKVIDAIHKRSIKESMTFFICASA